MMMKMLVPVAVLAAGLSLTAVKAVANPFADKAGLARTAASSMVKEKATSMAKERATKVATKAMTKTVTSGASSANSTVSSTTRSTSTAASSSVSRQTARATTRTAQKKGTVKKVASAKGNRGDITGSIRRNESCSIKMVDLFDKSGNYAKTERMRVCL